MTITKPQKVAISFLAAALLTASFFVTTAVDTYASSDRTSSSTAQVRVKTERLERATTTKTKVERVERATSTASSSRARGISEKTASSSVDTACVVTAVTKREEALTKAWGDLSESITAALTKRSEDLVAAWGKTSNTERLTANKAAWSTWKDAKAQAQKSFKDTRKEVWASFKTTMKNECKVSLPKEENLEKATTDSLAI